MLLSVGRVLSVSHLLGPLVVLDLQEMSFLVHTLGRGLFALRLRFDLAFFVLIRLVAVWVLSVGGPAILILFVATVQVELHLLGVLQYVDALFDAVPDCAHESSQNKADLLVWFPLRQ